MTSPHPDPQGGGQDGAASAAGAGESAAAGGAYDPRRQVAAKARSAAPIVCAMSSSPCAADTNPASYAEGAK